MKKSVLVALLFIASVSFGQIQKTITTIDFVKIKNDRQKEALFFYENNWRIYREIAFQRGFIKSYHLLTTTADSTANFDLLLMTEYADSSQYKLSEQNFQKIIKETRPDGPKLLNELKPNDFRQNVFFKRTETLFTSGEKQTKKGNRSRD